MLVNILNFQLKFTDSAGSPILSSYQTWLIFSDLPLTAKQVLNDSQQETCHISSPTHALLYCYAILRTPFGVVFKPQYHVSGGDAPTFPNSWYSTSWQSKRKEANIIHLEKKNTKISSLMRRETLNNTMIAVGDFLPSYLGLPFVLFLAMFVLLEVAFTSGSHDHIWKVTKPEQKNPINTHCLHLSSLKKNARGKSALRSKICSMDLLRFAFLKKATS